MKVVIFCGGMGTRLKEETEFKPKPMVLIGDRPILWHILKCYAHYGYKESVLCLGYKGDKIKEYFYHYEIMANDFKLSLGQKDSLHIFHRQNEADWNLVLANTGEKTLKGARLKKVQKYVDSENFLVTYGDGVSDIDINRLVEFHMRHGKTATLTGVRPLSRFGKLEVDGNRVTRFSEKPQSAEGLINGGFFVFNRRIFNYLNDQDDCDLEIGALEQLALEDQLMVYKHDGFWACMDTYRDVEYLNRLWTMGKAQWKKW